MRNPGLYRLKKGSRLGHLVEKAGGFTDSADTDDINLALRLSDGVKVRIPRAGILRRMGIGEGPEPTYIRPPIIPERVY